MLQACHENEIKRELHTSGVSSGNASNDIDSPGMNIVRQMLDNLLAFNDEDVNNELIRWMKYKMETLSLANGHNQANFSNNLEQSGSFNSTLNETPSYVNTTHEFQCKCGNSFMLKFTVTQCVQRNNTKVNGSQLLRDQGSDDDCPPSFHDGVLQEIQPSVFQRQIITAEKPARHHENRNEVRANKRKPVHPIRIRPENSRTTAVAGGAGVGGLTESDQQLRQQQQQHHHHQQHHQNTDSEESTTDQMMSRTAKNRCNKCGTKFDVRSALLRHRYNRPCCYPNSPQQQTSWPKSVEHSDMNKVHESIPEMNQNNTQQTTFENSPTAVDMVNISGPKYECDSPTPQEIVGPRVSSPSERLLHHFGLDAEALPSSKVTKFGLPKLSETSVEFVASDGKRQFRCPICFNNYANRSGLNRHYVTHSPDDLWKAECDLCGKKYSRKDSLKHHIKTQHANDCDMNARRGNGGISLRSTPAKLPKLERMSVDEATATSSAATTAAGENADIELLTNPPSSLDDVSSRRQKENDGDVDDEMLDDNFSSTTSELRTVTDE